MTEKELHIEKTQSTPAVETDSRRGVISLSGDAYPENSFEFFSPILHWTENRLAQQGQDLTLELKLVYLNTSSVKAMMDLFDMLEDAHQNGKSVRVDWYYDPRNERVVEMVEEFKEDCSFPFNITAEA